MSQKLELVIAALQERIGQMAASYETQIAVLRAELTEKANEENQRQAAINDYSQELGKQLEG